MNPPRRRQMRPHPLRAAVTAATLVALLGGCSGSGSGTNTRAAGVQQNSSHPQPAPGTVAFAFVLVNGSSGSAPAVVSYSVNTQGALSAVQTTQVSPGAMAVATDPTGHFLFLANGGSNRVATFTINSDGSLTASAAAEVTTGSNPTLLFVNSAGTAVYAVNQGEQTTSQFALGTDGVLSPLAPAKVPGQLAAIDAAASLAYVWNPAQATDPATLSPFSIATNGSLSSAPIGVGTLIDPAVGMVPVWPAVAIDTSGQHLYVWTAETYTGSTTLPFSAKIAGFGIGSQGQLTPDATTVDLPSGNFPGPLFQITGIPALYMLSSIGVDTDTGYLSQVALDSSGNFVAGTSSAVTGIGNGAAIAAGSISTQLVVLSRSTALNGSSGGWLQSYQAGADGTLTPETSATIANGETPVAMAVAAAQ